MIKFISTPPKDRPLTFSNTETLDTTVEVSTEQDGASVDILLEMFCSFLLAIGYPSKSVEEISPSYNPCSGCEFVAELNGIHDKWENGYTANIDGTGNLVWVPDPDGVDPDAKIEGEPI